MSEFKFDRINVSVSVTRNLGDYNSIKATAGGEGTVGPDMDIKEAFAVAWKLAEDEIEAQISEAVEELENA